MKDEARLSASGADDLLRATPLTDLRTGLCRHGSRQLAGDSRQGSMGPHSCSDVAKRYSALRHVNVGSLRRSRSLWILIPAARHRDCVPRAIQKRVESGPGNCAPKAEGVIATAFGCSTTMRIAGICRVRCE